MADQINIALNQLLSNNLVSSAVTLGLSFYAYKASPALPSFMEELFENVFFQIFVGFMVLYMNTQNVMLSLVVSVVFIYGMKMFAGIKEGMFGGDSNDCDKSGKYYDPFFYEFVKQSNDSNLTKKYNDVMDAWCNETSTYDKRGRDGFAGLRSLKKQYGSQYLEYLNPIITKEPNNWCAKKAANDINIDITFNNMMKDNNTDKQYQEYSNNYDSLVKKDYQYTTNCDLTKQHPKQSDRKKYLCDITKKNNNLVNQIKVIEDQLKKDGVKYCDRKNTSKDCEKWREKLHEIWFFSPPMSMINRQKKDFNISC